MIADKGYDSKGVLAKIKELGASAVVPPKSKRKVQREYYRELSVELYRERNLIERTFNKLKRFRRLMLYATTGKPFTSALFCTWRLPSYGFDSNVDSP